MKYTEDFSEQIKLVKDKIDKADAVVLGAGAGLSTAAGFTYDGERFNKYFSDFSRKYGFKDMYSGGFYPYDTLEEYWAYWSRYVYINRYMDAPKPLYNNIFSIIANKEYFVITTNVDHCFQKAGIDKERLFYTQGDYGLFQCSKPCSQLTYDNEKMIRSMLQEQRDMKITAELVPVCADDTFVEDEGWHKAAKRYYHFLDKHNKDNVVFIELGVGYNTPVIIKYPFWQMTKEWKNAFYICINKGQAYAPEDISEKAICINKDIAYAADELLKLY